MRSRLHHELRAAATLERALRALSDLSVVWALGLALILFLAAPR